tara:strand:- start:43 stop:390 length:348 start_codon:yes stop_codon:yes gene_type:complete
LPFIYDVATREQNWQTALDHCGQVANSKAVALFGQNKLGFDFTISAKNTFYVTHDKGIAYYLKTFGHCDIKGSKTLNEPNLSLGNLARRQLPGRDKYFAGSGLDGGFNLSVRFGT